LKYLKKKPNLTNFKGVHLYQHLINLYKKTSKHSNYQILPARLNQIINGSSLQIKSRFEKERLAYILSKISVQGKTILDIGGNTGFFSFELIDNGAVSVDYFEGNNDHADFVKAAAKILDEQKIVIHNSYFTFNNAELKNLNFSYDISLLLNVLHHYGYDYGNSEVKIHEAKEEIIKQLNLMSSKTKIVVFQLGFNWKGDKTKPLFENGTKSEMIKFVEDGTKSNWEILNIGIAEQVDKGIKYFDLDEKNIERNDKLGEFLNRPIFILKSKLIYQNSFHK